MVHKQQISAANMSNYSPATETCDPSLHDALPISQGDPRSAHRARTAKHRAQASAPAPAWDRCRSAASRWSDRSAEQAPAPRARRSEEHTSELQSRENLVCRLLLEKKKYSAMKPKS